MSTHDDLVTLGAALLPTRDLVRLLCAHRRRLSNDELEDAVRALFLAGSARDAALRAHRAGPALLAALELGRRAWLLPSPHGRRVRGPSDVAAIARPHGADALGIALDVRMRVARVFAVEASDVAPALAGTLAAGCTRVIVAVGRAGPAVPTPDDVAHARKLADAARIVGAHLVDLVVLGDDGLSSLARLGLLDDASASHSGYR